MRVAEALKALRDSLGLSREEAAALSGAVPRAEVLERWECGDEAPDVMSLNAYLEVLGFDFHDLQNALEGIDASPAAMPVDWLDEFAGAPPQDADGRKALKETLNKLEKMYGDQKVPDEVEWLKAKMRSQLESDNGLD